MTHEEARRYFDYDPDTGEVTNRITRSSRVKAGDTAGGLNTLGYLQVGVNKRTYLVHRLIWLWVHGYFPEHNIDHINRNSADNRLENLREVTQSCNIRNASRLGNNKSGVTGVCWRKVSGKWRAYIKINNKDRHLGYFQDFTEAVKARHRAEIEYNWPGCNSSTPAYQYLKETHNGV